MTSEEWRTFEIERWNAALRQRGLRLRSLDPEHQKALVERLWSTLRSRNRLLIPEGFVVRLRIIGRAFLIAGLLALGFGAGSLPPSVWHWTHSTMLATIQESCMIGDEMIPSSQSESAQMRQCFSESSAKNRSAP